MRLIIIALALVAIVVLVGVIEPDPAAQSRDYWAATALAIPILVIILAAKE